MNRYSVIIHLSDGSRVDAKAVGENQADAIEMVKNSQHVISFIGDREITKVDISFLEKVTDVSEENYILQKSTIRDNWYVVTDKINNVVIQFERGKYNTTSKVTPLDDTTNISAIDMATIIREIGEYIYKYHKDLL